MDSELTGQNAEAVFRDKITGEDYRSLVVISCSKNA